MVENEEWKKHRKVSLYKAKNLMDQLTDSHAVY